MTLCWGHGPDALPTGPHWDGICVVRAGREGCLLKPVLLLTELGTAGQALSLALPRHPLLGPVPLLVLLFGQEPAGSPRGSLLEPVGGRWEAQALNTDSGTFLCLVNPNKPWS